MTLTLTAPRDLRVSFLRRLRLVSRSEDFPTGAVAREIEISRYGHRAES